MKILDFHSYLALNEQEAFYVKLPDLAKNTSSFRTELVKALKEAGLTVEIFKSGLGELKTGKLGGELGKDSVKVLQMLLGLKADGAYGPATKQAVKNFQNTVLKFGESDENKAKRPDGIWGPETAKASFGDKDNQGPLYALQLISGMEGVDSKLYGAAKEMLLALMGNTENEAEVYRVMKDYIKTANDFSQLESLWNSMMIDKSILKLQPSIYKDLTFEQIKQKNKFKGVKTPMSLREVIKDYFDFQEKNKLNQLLPAGVEKF